MFKKILWITAIISVVGFIFIKIEQNRAADEASLWAEATDVEDE